MFQEVETAPVKVGETYEPVDTQEPDMEAKLADTIRTAVQSGAEKVEIRLMPENLGRLTIEMTRDSSGALQVVLHASNSIAELRPAGGPRGGPARRGKPAPAGIPER